MLLITDLDNLHMKSGRIYFTAKLFAVNRLKGDKP